MSLSFALLALCLCVGVASIRGYETYESFDVEAFQGIEVKRVPPVMYLTLSINSPSTAMSDFRFMTSYSYEQLTRYNMGDNYDRAQVSQTTPMFIKLDILDMAAPRSVSFLIPKELRENPPAPRYPLHLQEEKEKYYFIKKCNETDLEPILHAAARLLVDLSYSRMPFEGTTVLLALYNYPPNEDGRANEIWVERSLKNEGYLVV